MNKHLSIVYDGITLYDGPVGKMTWVESGAGTVEVRADPPRPGLREQLQAAMNQHTALPSGSSTNGGGCDGLGS